MSYCSRCGKATTAGDAFCGKCGATLAGRRERAEADVVVKDVVGSLVAVGDGNVQVQLTVEGTSQVTQRNGGVDLSAREIPALTVASRVSLVGRETLVEQACQALSDGRSVQLFGTPGVGRSAVAESVLQRLAATDARCVEVRPGNEPHTLESLYRRLMDVFFGVIWYQPDEAVLRLEVARFGLHALIMITDCDLDAGDLGRLLGTFPGCTFLLTSHRRTLSEDAGAALEVDPLSPAQARELITRALGGAPAGLQNLQWEEAYRLAGGQVQRLMEHIAFIKRATSRAGQTDLLNVPIGEQVTVLVSGLSEAARRVVVAIAAYRLALAPSAFAAVTGLPGAAGAADELQAAGVVSAEGQALRIVTDAAEVIAGTGELPDPALAADGLLRMLAGPEPPDPHLVLAVARALRAAGDDVGAVRLTRAGAPVALAAGAIGVWISLVALGAQASTSSRRNQDLAFFLGEERTAALLRGDMVAAAAALAAIGELLARQQLTAVTGARPPYQAGPHGAVSHQGTAVPGDAQARQLRRALHQGRHGRFASHPAVVIAAAAGVAVIAGVATAVVVRSRPAPPPSVAGVWADNGTTFTFAPSGPDSFTVSEVSQAAPQCANPHDGTVTGSNGHYQGHIDLYPSSGSGDGGCISSSGTAPITIAISANGAVANVNIAVVNNCTNCGQQTWTRRS